MARATGGVLGCRTGCVPPPLCSRMQRYKGTPPLPCPLITPPVCSRMQRYKGTHTLRYGPGCSATRVQTPSNLLQDAGYKDTQPPPIRSRMQRFKGTHPLQYAPGGSVTREHTPSGMQYAPGCSVAPCRHVSIVPFPCYKANPDRMHPTFICM